MIEFATPIEVAGPAVDIVGSGGDRAHTVNISTMAAIVVAAAGARVVKHGNRAATSACGAADVLEALGVVLGLAPEYQQQVIDRTGIGFLFAAHYHPALRLRGCGPQRARRSHDLQLPRPVGQSGPADRPGGRRRGRPDGGADGRGLRGPRQSRHGDARRRRAGRADDDDDVNGLALRRRPGHPDRAGSCGPWAGARAAAGPGRRRRGRQRAGGARPACRQAGSGPRHRGPERGRGSARRCRSEAGRLGRSARGPSWTGRTRRSAPAPRRRSWPSGSRLLSPSDRARFRANRRTLKRILAHLT